MGRLFNFRPAVFIPASYALGVAGIYFVAKSLIFIGILVLIIPAVISVFVCLFSKCNKRFVLTFMLVCEVIVLLGSTNIVARYNSFLRPVFNEDNVVITARCVGIEKLSDSYRISFDSGEFVACGLKVEGERFKSYSTTDCALSYGDVVKFSASVKSTAYFGDEYTDFDAFLVDDDYRIYPNFTTIEFLDRKLTIFEHLRIVFEDAIYDGMGYEEAALTSAMLFGDKDDLSEEFISATGAAGIAHIFAVSGLHVGFVAATISFLLSKLKVNRGISTFFSILATFLYCGICNFSPSAMRAFLMFSVYKVYRLFGEKYDMLNSIALSVIIILIIQPIRLYSVGFMMSYAAVISITIFAKPICRVLSFLPNVVSESIGTIVSAQLGVMPLTILFFGTTTFVGLFLNFFLIPVISIFFGFQLLSVLLATITTFSGFLAIPNFLNGLLLRLISDINYGYFVLSSETVSLIVFLFYIALILSSDLSNLKYGVKYSIFLCSSMALILFSQLFTLGVL